MKNRIPIEELIKAEAQAIGETTQGNIQGSSGFKWAPYVIPLILIGASLFVSYQINRGTQIKYRLNGKENEGRDSN